jgi:flagellin-specific chaperone FliS
VVVPLRDRGTHHHVSGTGSGAFAGGRECRRERKGRAVKQEGIDAYRVNQVTGASPGQMILLLYDHVIRCLKAQDMHRASKGIVELMSSLDVDYQEISGRLFSLYEYCLDLVKKGDYDRACRIFTEMRQMWAAAVANRASQETVADEPTKETVDVEP